MNKLKNIMLLLVLSIVLSTSVASANTLNLVQKDSGTWVEFVDGARAVLTYNPIGMTFDYVLTGTVPTGVTYALIYYKDVVGDWGNIGAVIAEDIEPVGETNVVSKEGSADIGTIPQSDDVNSPDGAKIWLIPQNQLSEDKKTMNGWTPNDYLFEENQRNDVGEEIPATSELVIYVKGTPTETFTAAPVKCGDGNLPVNGECKDMKGTFSGNSFGTSSCDRVRILTQLEQNSRTEYMLYNIYWTEYKYDTLEEMVQYCTSQGADMNKPISDGYYQWTPN